MMSSTGPAYFSYLKGMPQPKAVAIKVNCGSSKLEGVLSQSFYERGLRLPYRNLVIHRDRNRITISTSLSLSEKGPSIFYCREYPKQEGLEEMLAVIDRYLADDSIRFPERYVGEVFRKFLVNHMGFTENAVYKFEASSGAAIRGKVSFLIPKQESLQEEYSLHLNDDCIDAISLNYLKELGKRISSKQKSILEGKSGSLSPDRFLKALRISPTRSKDNDFRNYKNLQKVISYFTDLAFDEASYSYLPLYAQVSPSFLSKPDCK